MVLPSIPTRLFEAVPGRAYYAIRFADIGEDWILGGSCFLCNHAGQVDRGKVETRWGKACFLVRVDPKLRCLRCGNRVCNRFVVMARTAA